MIAAPPCEVVVVGGLNLDYLVRTAQLPRPDASTADGQFVRSCGGKGLNQAVAVARLGVRTTLIGAVGGDGAGAEAIARLTAERVGVDFVKRHPESSTGVAVIQVDGDGRKQTAAAIGANSRMAVDQIVAATDTIARARILLVQLEVPMACVARALQIAREHQVGVILDPAPARPVSDGIIDDVEVLKPNAVEARMLTGLDVHDQGSAVDAAYRLRQRGARNVIVSTATGSLLLAGQGAWWYPNLPVETVDTTGAGDAFAGALAVALVEGRALSDAVAFAHAAAALATTQVGALPSLPYRDPVDQLWQAVQARPIH
jgi:ribokinase